MYSKYRINLQFCCLLLGIVYLLLPTGTRADGLMIIHDPPNIVPRHFSFTPLEVSFHRVNVEINDQIAVTTVDQEFFNPNTARLEGTYLFPLPEGAHIDKFAMDVNGKMMEAELLSADKARAFYEEIVRKAKDPALLEYVGRGAFKVRIFPIEPNARKQIKITYTQLLKNDSGLVEYIYPLNTEKFSSALLKEVAVKVILDGKESLKSVYCPTHNVEIQRNGNRRAIVGYEAKNVRPDTDFRVIFSRRSNPVGIDLITSRKAGEDGYFMLLASPGISAPKTAIQPKDICFVLDTSGSMAIAKLDQAKKALRFCLANLNENDRFEIIRFSTEAEQKFNTLVVASKENLAKADEFITNLKPIGGTAISDALNKALALRSGDNKGEERPYLVIFLTDGIPTIGETNEDTIVAQLRKARGNTRIFSFGIGVDVNTHLLDRVAEQTRGSSQYVLPTEDIEVKVSNFYTKIKEPVLSNLSLTFTNPEIRITELYPNTLPDLFNGDMLTVFGRYSGKGPAAARITGMLGDRKHEFVADVQFPDTAAGNDFVPQLWATRRVGWLLDEIRMHGESTELKDEVTRLARQYGIVTPYTAYLIIEDEARRNVPLTMHNLQEMERDQVAVERSGSRLRSISKEASSADARSGAAAVDNAMALQQMKSGTVMPRKNEGHTQHDLNKSVAENLAQAVSSGKIGYHASQTQNYAQQARVVNGRAFFQNGDVWIDSTAQAQKNLKEKKVIFNSDAYFDLLRQHPNAAQWLSLGNKIDVVIDGILYQIRGS
jgi:Ca-activated chloride channel homolog